MSKTFSTMKPKGTKTEEITTPIYPAGEVARFFIHLANQDIIGDEEEGGREYEGITNLKLQKMLYFAQAYYLGSLNRTLFDDLIQARAFGPVVPAVYDKYKQYGNGPIAVSEAGDVCLIETDKKILEDRVWKMFGCYSASYLTQMSTEHIPWKSAIGKGQDQTIPTEDLKDYYSGILDS